MDKEKQIAALNNLIEINNDRVEGYKTAADEAQSQDLRDIFGRMQATSRENVTELNREVQGLGGTPEDGTRTTGKFFRAWMDVRAALTGNDRHAILSSCEFGEDKALKTYDDVLESRREDLSGQQVDMIRRQHSNLRQEHDRIKAMRDAEKALKETK